MKRFSFLVLGFTLSACATQSAKEPPVVDLAGIDTTKYQRDQSECIAKGQDWGFGAPITNCMRERGYKILVPKS